MAPIALGIEVFQKSGESETLVKVARFEIRKSGEDPSCTQKLQEDVTLQTCCMTVSNVRLRAADARCKRVGADQRHVEREVFVAMTRCEPSRRP